MSKREQILKSNKKAVFIYYIDNKLIYGVDIPEECECGAPSHLEFIEIPVGEVDMLLAKEDVHSLEKWIK